jgi:predicted glycoside hydrolase/deacetylase ChbG (UPF0249 family)/glycosyltransferase involved in cell wall biosynthesis
VEHTLRIASPPRRLIINADDLGIGTARDAGILELFAAGAITSASLLVNGPSAATGAAGAVAAGLPLGLHLNLSEGRCLGSVDVSSLTDADGKLLGKQGIRQALAAGQVRQEDLVREIRAQFDRFIALTGELPSHVDGHHHVHVEPFVAAALAPIMAREYGVYCVRLPQQTGLDAMTGDAEFDMAFQQAVAAAASTARPLFAAHGIYSTAAFLGQSLMGTRLTAVATGAALEALAQAYRPTPNTPLSVELMVHPGVPASDVTSSAFCRSPARAHEMAVLQSAAWHSAIAGWQLDSYRALPRPTDSEDDRPSVLIYGKLTPATGNAETARRYEAAWSPLAHVRFRPVPNDITTSTRLAREALRLQEFATRECLDFALGIHLYRAGTALAAAFAQASAPLLPYGLLASGTDVNADIDDPVRRAAIAGALQSAEFLLCLNAAQQARLKPFGLPADTRVLGNGIDVATDSRYSLRQTFGLSDTMQLVLFPASLRRLKGVLPTVEALAQLLASRYTSHVLVVLGPALETDYAREVHEHIATLNERHPNLSGRIHLHDGLPHEDYLAALQEADLVLNASEHEGLSHGIAEAMAAGIPVLARDIAGNRLLVRDGENGRLFTDFAALPGAYAACFEDGEATRRLATQARIDIAAAHPADTEQQVLRDVLQTVLARRQASLTLPGTEALRLDLAPGTHPVSAENAAIFRSIALSPAAAAQLPEVLDLAIDAGCGCGVFGFHLLGALARQGKQLKRMIFADPHLPSLAALGRTLRRHAQQLPMLESAMLSDGSLLQPLLDRGEKAALICANLPQTPGPEGFRLDRYGGRDGADLLCALIAQLPATLTEGGEAFLLHISLAHPERVAQTLAANDLVSTVLAEQPRTAALADYDCLHPGLADYLLQEQAAGRAVFVRQGDAIAYTAQLLRIARKP